MSALIRRLACVDYLSAWESMREFTARRTAQTPDEFWVLEHPPVFTLGQSGKPEHLLRNVGIPLIPTDRGGQITYHGPGQAIVYPLLDLNRRQLKIKEWVRMIEDAVITLLADLGVAAARRPGAPGVYVGEAKIASLGLRVRNGCCYHGVALNVDVDLAPFLAINPCGYAGLAVTRTRDLGLSLAPEEAGLALVRHLLRQLEP